VSVTIRDAKRILTGQPVRSARVTLGWRDGGKKGATLKAGFREDIPLDNAFLVRQLIDALTVAEGWLRGDGL